MAGLKGRVIQADVQAYIQSTGLREHPVLRWLRDETARHPRAMMQIEPEEGALLQQLVRFGRVRRIVEIGVFTGYSSTAMALALPEDGQLVACDVSDEYTRLAREAWQRAGVAHKVELHLAPAQETLDALLSNGQEGTVDLVFIDADKPGYDAYYERALRLLRPGGLIAIDNVLWDGKVFDPGVQDPDTVALRSLNDKLLVDERIELAMVPIADGLTLALKR
jgi:caffeoyl-CoA O-methyltransferase